MGNPGELLGRNRMKCHEEHRAKTRKRLLENIQDELYQEFRQQIGKKNKKKTLGEMPAGTAKKNLKKSLYRKFQKKFDLRRLQKESNLKFLSKFLQELFPDFSSYSLCR